MSVPIQAEGGVDLTPLIIQYCKTLTDLVSLVGDRIIASSFDLKDGNNEANPKLAVKQVGGGDDYYKYQFLVRADTLQSARQVALILKRHLQREVVDLPSVNLEWIRIDGSITDNYDEQSRNPEAFFYANFYFLEA